MGDLDDLYDLRDEMDRTTQTYEQAERSLEPVSGFDEDGVVTVTLDADGSFVDVRVTDDWLTYYAPEEIGGVVMTAYTMAASLRLGNWISAVEEAPRPMTRPLDTASQLATQIADLVGDAPIDNATALNGMMQELDEFEGVLARALSQLGEAAGGSASANDVHGRVTATANARGELVSIDIDPEFAERSTGAALGQSLTSAIKGAIRAGVTPGTDPLAELNAFIERMQDPRHAASVLDPERFRD